MFVLIRERVCACVHVQRSRRVLIWVGARAHAQGEVRRSGALVSMHKGGECSRRCRYVHAGTNGLWGGSICRGERSASTAWSSSGHGMALGRGAGVGHLCYRGRMDANGILLQWPSKMKNKNYGKLKKNTLPVFRHAKSFLWVMCHQGGSAV